MAIQYASLQKTITETDLKVFRQDPSYNVSFWYSSFGGVLLGIFIGLVPATIVGSMSISTSDSFVITYVLIVMISAVVGFGVMRLIRRYIEKRLYRYTQFARDNHLEYIPKIESPSYPGMIFQQGHSTYSKNIFVGSTDTKFEIGNYYYTTGSGKNRQSHDWGYVSIPLPRHVPNMVLDAKSNNMGVFGLHLTNLPTSYKKDQTLSLEGNFDDYFTLYAPKEYERDALYIFTPDLMALLIDNSAKFDVETVDDKLYIYSSIPFDLLDQQLLEKLFAIIATIGKKTLSQTASYADERIGNKYDDRISEPGKRLKPSIVGTVIFTAIFVILYFAIAYI